MIECKFCAQIMSFRGKNTRFKIKIFFHTVSNAHSLYEIQTYFCTALKS